MTRGRKKDLTIPPSRALAQQRDYRARKAQYVEQLEKRCQATENENVRLKKELDLARAGVPSMFSPQAAELSAELLKQLNAAASTLSQFQRHAYPAHESYPSPPTPLLHPASFPSPPPSASAAAGHTHEGRARSQSQRSPIQQPSPDFSEHVNLTANAFRGSPSPEPSLGSECCGGLIDCTDLVEDEYDELQDDDQDEDEDPATSYTRTSSTRANSDKMDVVRPES
ncbi:hypothetical protein FIBSPDRAFT_880806 [Athelia psychrophila]|uniref:BZIP domain-containing protein n=1 Tax=Athelia psychrophila TaxID=1759441 RepID=A0A166WYE9_9AGAM|nr:hypothetical protein FIBSPDRAFT_880806 [Fibularhizoctonia sp. CBS 109695]